MRLWSLHPKYLDRQGLLACWRESLLAQKVLKGETRGYKNHPQLMRFRSRPDPLAAIGSYLSALADEADRRGYHFERSRIDVDRPAVKIPVTVGQLNYEWGHLKEKLNRRDPGRLREMMGVTVPESHPSFDVIEGGIEAWEKLPNNEEPTLK
jgi:hypothetical protein